jgi:hypothetical protein
LSPFSVRSLLGDAVLREPGGRLDLLEEGLEEGPPREGVHQLGAALLVDEDQVRVEPPEGEGGDP